MAVTWKRDHCDFSLLFIFCAVNPTIHLQFNIAGRAERKKELDWFIIRWTWKLWWCVFFPSTLKPKQCDLTFCILLNSLLHLPGGCSSAESSTKASWWGRKGPGKFLLLKLVCNLLGLFPWLKMSLKNPCKWIHSIGLGCSKVQACSGDTPWYLRWKQGVDDDFTDSLDPDCTLDCFELLEAPGNGVLDSMGWEIWKELAGHQRDISDAQ